MCKRCVSWYNVKLEGGVLQHRRKFLLIKYLSDNVLFETLSFDL